MIRELGPYLLGYNDTPECGIYTSDARELARAIPDESVDLIFTDPVYQNIDDYRWLAETAARVLKPGGACLAYSGYYWLDKVLAALSSCLDYRWILTERKINARDVIWHYHLFSQTKPLIWYSKGDPTWMGGYRCDCRNKQNEGNKVNHEWSKGEHTVIAWLASFSYPGAIVWEPFCGGGSTVASCKLLGLLYLAFEIDPATADKARARVRQTQPPLFVPEAEQAVMPL